MADQDRAKPAGTEPAKASRKRYTAPRLEEYGHVSKLTQGGGSTKAEPGNPIKKMCL